METDEIEVRDTAIACEWVFAIALLAIIAICTCLGLGAYYFLKMISVWGNS